MNATRFLTVAALMTLASLTSSSSVFAQWQPGPPLTDGRPTWRHNQTGLTWTVTLGRLPSADNGVTARAELAKLGFRLPTFAELQGMYNFGQGGPVLGVRNGLLDYYETANPNVLGNAFGNGFQTPQPRKGVGYNWVIGVKP